MEFQLLGPVEVRTGGRTLDTGPRQQRAVLAALAVDAGRSVALQALVDRVWGEAPPNGARSALYAHIARIRRLLEHAAAGGAVPLPRRSGGYLLDVDPQCVDVHRFRRLVARAREARYADGERVALLREALALWRGEPLAGLQGSWVERMRVSWRRQRLDAVVAWADTELRLGNVSAVLGPLADLADEHPLVEPLVAVLMRAHYAAGRAAEALDCYAATRQRLIDELGNDPGPELRALHQAILRGDLIAAPARVPAPARASSPAAVVPAQLPLDVHGFAGRGAELARLDAIMAAADEPTAVVVCALSGTAGVGKTALAVHWAHRVRHQFPDGQIYVNLHGFEPSGPAMTHAEAVRGLLDALGVPPQRVPASLAAQAGLYRSLLASRRVLVVLDNARDAEQVRPLLPGSPTALVLVTSRSQLLSLVAVEGAQPLTLDVLTAAEARELLARRLGRDRVAAEPVAVDEIISRCARLPLALVIVAARAGTHAAFSLKALAAELRAAQGGVLDVFEGGDDAANVRAVLSWSYEKLGAEEASLFRLLRLHPGRDITLPAAASLAGASPHRVRPVLTELARAHLVAESEPGRFTAHDLLRAYASELGDSRDSAAARRKAHRRLLDHYLHTAHAAAVLLKPDRDPIAVTAPLAGVTVADIADRKQALAWFTAEQPALLALVDLAATLGLDTHTWQLSWTLATFFGFRGHWQHWVTTGRTALAAARRLADRLAQAGAHRNLARAYGMLGRYDDAQTHLRQALDVFAELGDATGQAHTHINVCLVLVRQGQYAEALAHTARALDLYRAAGDRRGQAYALNDTGWCHAQLGDHQQALDQCARSLAVHQEVGNRHGESEAWDSLGYIHHQLGDHGQATTCYAQALSLYRDLGDRYNEATTLTYLGDAHHGAGEPASARDAWQLAADILDELDHPDADKVRAALDGAGTPPVPSPG